MSWGLTTSKIIWCLFVRTVGEAKQVVELLGENGLSVARNGFAPDHYVAELPAKRVAGRAKSRALDGFSHRPPKTILTQLTLGLDRVFRDYCPPI